jgi:outer membrane protein assembly factor BamB
MSIICIAGCNKLRIRDIPENQDGPANYSYHTSQINYQRNAFSNVELAPPLTPVWEESYNAMPNKGFTVIDEWLFFGTTNGYLAAANLNDGDQEGKKNLGEACPAPPTVWRNIIFQSFESGNFGLIAYDINKGGPVWSKEGYNSTSAPVIFDNKLYHLATNGMLFCLNYMTGEIIWQKYVQDQFNNSLSAFGDMILIAALSGNVTAVHATSGATVWHKNVGSSVFADPVIAQNRLFITDYSGFVHKMDIQSGEILNSKDFGLNLYHAPTISDSRLFLGLSNGKLVALDINTFELINTFSGRGPVSGPPLVTNSYIYFTTLAKYLYILDKKSLTLLQDIELDARVRSTPAIFDGKLVVIIEDKKAIAFAQPE